MRSLQTSTPGSHLEFGKNKHSQVTISCDNSNPCSFQQVEGFWGAYGASIDREETESSDVINFRHVYNTTM